MTALDREGIRRRAAELGLGDWADALAELARPSIRLRTVDGTSDPLGTRLGGQPALPAGVEWPRLGERPLSFIAQIRLAELGPLGPSMGLPADGLLAFFYDAQEQPWGFDDDPPGSWHVVWFNGLGGLTIRPWPNGFATAERFDAVRVELARELTLPDWDSFEVEGLGLGEDDAEPYETLQQAVETEFGGHRMFGYPTIVQSELRNSPEEQLLLQVDSDDRWMWGDTGFIYFTIDAHDLANRAFDRVRLTLQCY